MIDRAVRRAVRARGGGLRRLPWVPRKASWKGVRMAAEPIGRVKSGSSKSYEVKWDHASHEVYVSYAGWTHIGRAASAGEAMRKAEAWLYDK